MPSKDVNKFLRDMEDFFGKEVPRRIEQTKRELNDLTLEWSQSVALNTPVGPSHRREFQEGDLRRSVNHSATDYGDNSVFHVSVGGGNIDYERFVAARDGVDFFTGSQEIERRGEDIMRRMWD